MEHLGRRKPIGVTSVAGQKVERLWPEPACPECADRPAVVGVPVGELEPDYPAMCQGCGRVLPPVVLVIGVADDAL